MKFLKIAVAVFFLGTFFVTIEVKYYFTRNRLETTQLELGRIIPARVFYNKTVYVTEKEGFLLKCIPWVQFSLFLGFATLVNINMRRKNSNLKNGK